MIVDNFTFVFAASVQAERYDQWAHWATKPGKKKVDVVAIDTTPSTTWLIEARDFRVISGPPRPSKISRLHDIIAQKMHDTLQGLTHAQKHAGGVEKTHSIAALGALSKRVVFHLEPHVGPHTALFPSGFPASVLQKLKILVAPIDPNPLLLDIRRTPRAGVPWSVS